MAALSHADVLACILRADVGQVQGVHLGPVTLQRLHEGEEMLQLNNDFIEAAVFLTSGRVFAPSAP